MRKILVTIAISFSLIKTASAETFTADIANGKIPIEVYNASVNIYKQNHKGNDVAEFCSQFVKNGQIDAYRKWLLQYISAVDDVEFRAKAQEGIDNDMARASLDAMHKYSDDTLAKLSKCDGYGGIVR